MAYSLNRVELIGNLGADPDMRSLPSGEQVASLSLATTEKFKTRDGEQKEHTEWHKISAFGKLADIIGQYVHKGDKLFIAGTLRTRKWQAQDGSDRYSTEIRANEMIMLGGEKRGDKPPMQGRKHVDTQAPADFDDDILF